MINYYYIYFLSIHFSFKSLVNEKKSGPPQPVCMCVCVCAELGEGGEGRGRGFAGEGVTLPFPTDLLKLVICLLRFRVIK